MKKQLFCTAGGRIIISVVLTAIVLVCASSFSCQLSPEGITLLGGTYSCPKLVGFSIEGKQQLRMTFSEKVDFSDLRIADDHMTADEFATEAAVPAETAIMENDDGTYQYDLLFDDGFDCGTSYVVYAVVEDSYGNSLSFSSGFAGYNDNLPQIALSEVRTEYSKPRLEFVELLVLSDGNLGGMQLEVYYQAKKNVFTFPAVEVHAGEYIVTHMRVVEEGSVDETGDITASTAPDSCTVARDFWYQSDVKALGKTGVILLRERGNGGLVDALLLAESNKSFWPKDEMKAAAQDAFLAGVWEGGAETSAAVCSDSCTGTRTVSRQDFTKEGASAWIVTAKSGETPGKPNSSKQ